MVELKPAAASERNPLHQDGFAVAVPLPLRGRIY
jgi:hypothetical protein